MHPGRGCHGSPRTEHRPFGERRQRGIPIQAFILALGLAGIDRGQLLLRGLELAQPLHSSAYLAAVQPLQGDQLLLLANGVARFADHQLEDSAQA
jgi:hypothetical protein